MELYAKISEQLLAVNYFLKKLYHRFCNRVLNTYLEENTVLCDTSEAVYLEYKNILPLMAQVWLSSILIIEYVLIKPQ